ncbi:hypothetical protein HYX19_00325 [Candidatus Woesearchaeota archaeon]|nr:hypothetical protein [Candidatus Woesearchaeota archaeon]
MVDNKDNLLTKIPILGYLFRKINENRKPIETTLKTERETSGGVEEDRWLWGLITITSEKIFNTLKLRRKK